MVLDDNTIQRFLFANADLFINKIKTGTEFTKSTLVGEKDNIVRIHKSGKQTNISLQESAKILFRQRQLLTNTSPSSTAAAIELFQNAARPNGTIDLAYTISHIIYVMQPEGLFYFNIDEVNASNEGKFFISKISIDNKSTDAFTSRSNYEIKLKINFTFFDDLLEDNVILKSVKGNLYIKYPLIKILYPNFSRSSNTNTNETKESRGQDGLLLSQVLNMPYEIQPQYFSNIKRDLQSSKIQRNFHLTFKNHVINVFSSNDQIFKRFENELDISYLSYESDSNKNIGSDKKTPKINDDLYDLLIKSNYNSVPLKSFFDTIKKINEEILKLQKEIDCYRIYKSLGTEKQQNLQNVSNVDVEKEIKIIDNLKKEIEKNRLSIKKILIDYILSNCQFYFSDLENDLLVNIRMLEAYDAFKKNFSVERLATAATAGGVVGAVGGLLGVVGGAGIGIGVDLFYQSQEAILNNQVASEKNNIRLPINSTAISAYPVTDPKEIGIQLNNQFDNPQIAVDLKEATENAKKALSEAGNSKVTAGSQKGEQASSRIYFTTFGHLIKLLNKLIPNIYIASGGNIVPTDIQGNGNFINYLDIPIALGKLTNFLSKEILESDATVISTEVFLRNAVEKLLKDVVKLDSKTTSNQIKEIIPTKLTFTTAMHSDDLFIKNGADDLLEDDKFNEARIALIRSSIITPERQQLRKIFFITGEEELKYYNFYDSFIDWPSRNLNNKLNFSSKEFQNFIIEEYNIPCILLNPVSMEETILKQKQVIFSRLDNPNLQLGNVIENDVTSLFRLPYQFNTNFKAYMAFFLDIASYIYIAPAYSQKETNVNTFGYGGLYMITKCNFEYDFQRLVANKPTIPNFDAKLSLTGRRISDGTSVKPQIFNNKQDQQIEECKKVQPVTYEPSESIDYKWFDPTSKL